MLHGYSSQRRTIGSFSAIAAGRLVTDDTLARCKQLLHFFTTVQYVMLLQSVLQFSIMPTYKRTRPLIRIGQNCWRVKRPRAAVLPLTASGRVQWCRPAVGRKTIYISALVSRALRYVTTDRQKTHDVLSATRGHRSIHRVGYRTSDSSSSGSEGRGRASEQSDRAKHSSVGPGVLDGRGWRRRR